MDWPLLFSLMNAAALGAWAILIAAPRRWALLGLVPRLAVPALVSVVYAALMAAHLFAAEGGFGSLAAVRTLFASDPLLVAGWGHYLAFDLIVGALLADRMDRAGIGRLLQAPVLLATFLVGPVGWLLGTAALAAAGALPELRPAAARGGEG